MTHHDLTDHDIKAMLGTVAHDRDVRHPDRDALGEAVLAEFRSAHHGDDLQPASPGPAIIELDPVPHAPRRAPASRPRVGRALAVAVVVAAALALVLPQRSNDTSVETAQEALPSLTDPSNVGSGPLQPGAYRAADVGGGLRLTLPNDVVVADAGPGFVELRPSANEWRSSLLVMTATESLPARLDAIRSQGLITDIQTVAATAHGLVTEFEVRPTNRALTEDCELDPACLAIGIAELDREGVNLVREIEAPDGQRVWTLYRSDTVYAPFAQTADAILATMTLANGNES